MKRLWCVLALSLMSSIAHAITPFDLPWANNSTRNVMYRSRDHANSLFVLEFFSNSCSACNQNAPRLKALKSKYANNPRVQVLDISLDASDREVAQWIARHRPNHPVLKDKARTLWRQVGAQHVPTVVITDCYGNEKYRHTDVWNTAVVHEVERTIDQLLSGGCAS